MKRFLITQRGTRSTEITRQFIVEVPEDESLGNFLKHLSDDDISTLADEARIPWVGGLPDRNACADWADEAEEYVIDDEDFGDDYEGRPVVRLETENAEKSEVAS